MCRDVCSVYLGVIIRKLCVIQRKTGIRNDTIDVTAFVFLAS